MSRHSAVLLLSLLLLGVTGCSEDVRTPEEVVRAWSEAINAGDDTAAAELFAVGAGVIQSGIEVSLWEPDDALRFNTSLPCSGEIVALESDGDMVRATFELGERPGHMCDAPGALAVALFQVERGKIVLWHQLPESGDEASTGPTA